MPYANKNNKYRRKGTKKTTLKTVKKLIKDSEQKTRESNYKIVETGAYAADGTIATFIAMSATINRTELIQNVSTVQVLNTDTIGSIGTRTQQYIWVKGISCKGQIRYPTGSKNGFLKIGLTQFKRPYGHTSGTISTELPDYMIFNDLNGARPEVEQVAIMRLTKRLVEKKFSFAREAKGNVLLKNFTLNYRFKTPLKITYDVADYDGANPNYSFHVCIMSNDSPASSDDQTDVACNTRIYYYTE
jgi:hypothetical protein